MQDQQDQILDQAISFERIIGALHGHCEGPVVVFTGGIHGNEPAGVLALQSVLNLITENKIKTSGHVYCIRGNLRALHANKRFIDRDLNRIWTKENIQQLQPQPTEDSEEQELAELHQTITSIINDHKGPFFFIDLHTTSSQTIPFITINDVLFNRNFCHSFPAPIVLGLEEYLDGPFLSYMNEKGYLSIGFEAGQHDNPESVRNHEAFILYALSTAGSIDANTLSTVNKRSYTKSTRQKEAFEIVYRFKTTPGDGFIMNPGYNNFDQVKKGDFLASTKLGSIKAPCTGKIFMPKYQSLGDDGFFIIRKIPLFSLRLSALLRRLELEPFFALLPGIHRNFEPSELVVNRHITRFLTIDLFHLLGFRITKWSSSSLTFKNREREARTKDYQGAPWN